jgi:hypothetical protein
MAMAVGDSMGLRRHHWSMIQRSSSRWCGKRNSSVGHFFRKRPKKQPGRLSHRRAKWFDLSQKGCPTARSDIAEFREMAREAGRDPASIEITSFGLGEDIDRVKRLAEVGVTRVVPMFPPEKAHTVLRIVDRWTKIMQQVNG